MESGIQSSFIPHDAATPVAPQNPRREGGGLGDLLILIAVVMFVASLALAGAVFLYEEYLATSASSKVEQLQRAKEAFEPSLIQELTRLDDRMHIADQVLGAHLAPTALFQTLEQATLSTISFESLELSASDPQRITVKMAGVAQSVNSIALQADLFSKNGVITNPIFSDINRQPEGVKFNLTALINPAAINYVHLVNAPAPSSTVAPAAQSAASFTPFGNQGQNAATSTPAPQQTASSSTQ